MDENLKILMIEDVEDDADLVLRELQHDGMTPLTRRVENEIDFREALMSFQPNIILSDHTLPQFSSVEALEIWKASGLNIPFILVTGTVSEEFAVKCLKLGADDYILKSNLSRLPTAIRSALHQQELESLKIYDEKALKQQNEELIKINAELDSFVYNVSHSLRSPLRSILGLTNLVQMELGEIYKESFTYMEMINKRVKDLDAILQDILNYSQNARKEISISKMNINELIHGCMDRMNYHLLYHKVDKSVNLEGPEIIYSDTYRITVILDNLISNAIKYSDVNKSSRFIRLEVTVEPESLKIEINDNGIGISADVLPHVFEMFYRGTEKSDGAGLGLYIVKEMIGRLNGTIDISSKEGEGTSFNVCIPNYPSN